MKFRKGNEKEVLWGKFELLKLYLLNNRIDEATKEVDEIWNYLKEIL